MLFVVIICDILHLKARARLTIENEVSIMNDIGKRIKDLRKKNDLTQEKLADFLGVDRSGLSAEISKLRKAGLLHCRKNEFELK